jgi:hypothetical protein
LSIDLRAIRKDLLAGDWKAAQRHLTNPGSLKLSSGKGSLARDVERAYMSIFSAWIKHSFALNIDIFSTHRYSNRITTIYLRALQKCVALQRLGSHGNLSQLASRVDDVCSMVATSLIKNGYTRDESLTMLLAAGMEKRDVLSLAIFQDAIEDIFLKDLGL